MTDSGMMWGMAKPEQTGVIKHPPGALTLPATLIQVDEWLKDAHATASGGAHLSQVTGTATSLSVS